MKSKLSEEKIDGKIFTDYISNKWQFPKEGDYLFSFMFNLELKESALIRKDLPLIPFYINKIRGLPTYKVIPFCDDEKNYQATMSSHGIVYSFAINMKSCY